jgi:hypothetical protein
MGNSQVSENDPTEYALAAIAVHLNKPETSNEADAGGAPEAETAEEPGFEPEEDILTAEPDAPELSSNLNEADSYTKYGPGPLVAVRFKWTTRRGDKDQYFVDETIGESSYPLVSGPMTHEAAIKFVDDRERDACQRFETLRSEMACGETGQRASE